ncbi:MAG: 50S ribosomal protein L7/L12 [Planctomycetales bacterium]|nr:50S ribosomal protein L7/L12 [Planctomycetales bacterium]
METDLEDLFQKLDALPIGRASKLVKALEERWGVSAAAPVAVAAMPGGGGGAAEEKKEEKTSFNVFLKDSGANKIQVIKVVREITALGLKEAKALVDGVPGTPGKLKENLPKEEADAIKKKVEEAGGQVTIQ